MATDSSSPSNNQTSAVSSQSSESLSRRPERRASPPPHEYTSLHDLLEFPCTCPLCTYLRQRRQPGRRPDPGPQLAGGIVRRLALATLLPTPLPTPLPPPRFRSKRLLLRRFLRGSRAPTDACLEFINRLMAAAISRALGRLVGAFQEAEEDGEGGGASPCGRLPFATC